MQNGRSSPLSVVWRGFCPSLACSPENTKFPFWQSLLSCLQWVVWLPLPRADQDRVRELHVLPPGSAHRQQEGAVGGESAEPGGGGDGQRQGSGHPRRIAVLHGSVHGPIHKSLPYNMPLICPLWTNNCPWWPTQGGRGSSLINLWWRNKFLAADPVGRNNHMLHVKKLCQYHTW